MNSEPQFEISYMPTRGQMLRISLRAIWKYGGNVALSFPVLPGVRITVEITRKIRAPRRHAWNCVCKECGYAGMPHD